ncbi:Cell division coordinator CpoB [hydrothermal vent metagenome]|uniref:Cell division coordinator CpoB n=1 Tax=hydrothermal vent metagenome TaxID=652676 RepID=A0A3B1BB85_9ZZZZ
MSKRYSSIFVFAAGVLLSPVPALAAPAPVIEASSQPGASAKTVKVLEARLARIERRLENRTLVDMALALESLQRENQQLLGQLEEQGYELESLKKRQRDLYLDVDRRLAQLEAAQTKVTAGASVAGLRPIAPVARKAAPLAAVGSVATSVAPVASLPASSTPDPVDEVGSHQEHDDYERAFNLLKEGRYDLAVEAFKAFVQTYPKGRYTDNAQYWLGEANYVQRNFKAALSEFEQVVNNFPDSPKRPDALLKMGYTYQALGDNDKARLSLNGVRMNYPDTTAARLAGKRLQELTP